MRKRNTLQEKLQKLKEQREAYKAKLQKVEAKIAEIEQKIKEAEERELLSLLRNSRLSLAEIREMLSQRDVVAQTAQAQIAPGASDAFDIVDRRSE